jgi:hypothetical protein
MVAISNDVPQRKPPVNHGYDPWCRTCRAGALTPPEREALRRGTSLADVLANRRAKSALGEFNLTG